MFFFLSPCDPGGIFILLWNTVETQTGGASLHGFWVISGRVLNFPDACSSQSVMQVLTEVNIGL